MVVFGEVSIFFVLFWAWVVVSLGIFVWRRVRGIPIRGARPESPDPPLPEPGLSDSADGLIVPPPPAFPVATPAAPETTEVPASSAPAPPVPPVSHLPAEPAGTARGGFFAAVPPGDSGPSDRASAGGPAPGRATVAEAVQGIAMPCGLSPVVDGSTSIPNPFRVSFVTSTAGPAEVGGGMADELERLGFTLATSTPTELIARRDHIELHVVLYPNAASAKRGLDPLFPAVPANAVGVELTT